MPQYKTEHRAFKIKRWLRTSFTVCYWTGLNKNKEHLLTESPLYGSQTHSQVTWDGKKKKKVKHHFLTKGFD